MAQKTPLIQWFKHIRIKDVPLVGGKNAALGEMFQKLNPLGISVPNGFAITAEAYRYFLKESGLKNKISRALAGLNTVNVRDLQNRGKLVRRLILEAGLPLRLQGAINEAYQELGRIYGRNPDVAVRSSATAEDLPGASFAGQQETYLNVVGGEQVLLAVKKCIASLFTDRAISYREDKGFSHFQVALSVGVQKMVRSDLASSGVMFTIDTETGFNKVVVINGVYGLGEMIVKGHVTPDEFLVFKPALTAGFKSIISKKLGKKNVKLVYDKRGTKEVGVSRGDRQKYSLTDQEVLEIAKWGIKIEEHFSEQHRHYMPMDIEWAKDGQSGKLFIVQARPETVLSQTNKKIYKEYRLKSRGRLLLEGTAVGTKIATGRIRIIKNPSHISEFKPGEILVSSITDPDWEPIMKIASGIITDKGGRTSHAAIVSRELGVPCLVGTKNGTAVLRNGMEVTVDCSSGDVGKVYLGKQQFEIIEHNLAKIPKTRTKIMVNIGSPAEAFKNHYLPVSGVGLGRLEFIIASQIKIHPNALIANKSIQKKAEKDRSLRKIIKEIDALTLGFKSKTMYYVEQLAFGIAKIGAAFWPHEVIIRFSDFKTNEYKTLIGGELYEPVEENPMLGWRGASRYYDEKFRKAFNLECQALKKVRQEFGLRNVVPMIPFCRTPEEGRKVLQIMRVNGLGKDHDRNLKIYVMCEIPSNILLADEFLAMFDGMSIGSNDLTQLTLGLDRDSGIVSQIANENNDSVKELIAQIIAKCRKKRKYIGICGQAPSDFPEFVAFLLKNKIDSISLNPDSVIKTIAKVAQYEKRL